jgi:hypothetical protein
VIDIQFEEMRHSDVLEDYLAECSFDRQGETFVTSSQPISIEKSALQVG